MASMVKFAIKNFEYVQVAQGCVGLIGNLLVCLTIVKTKSMHNVTNFLLLNLAVADACVSIMAIFEPTVGTEFRTRLGVFGYCTPSFIYNFNSFFTTKCFQRGTFTCSILSLTLATFERYIGIIHPFQHSSFLTKRKIIMMLSFIWVVPILLEIPGTVAYIILYEADNCIVPNYSKYPGLVVQQIGKFVIAVVLPCIALSFMYIKIMINLKTGARHLEEQGIQGPPQELYRARKKVTQALGIVTAAFFILIMPSQLIRIVLVYSNLLGSNYEITELVTKTASFLIYLNSAINPVVYGFKCTQLRRACVAIICPCSTRCNRSNQVQQDIQVISVE